MGNPTNHFACFPPMSSHNHSPGLVCRLVSFLARIVARCFLPSVSASSTGIHGVSRGWVVLEYAAQLQEESDEKKRSPRHNRHAPRRCLPRIFDFYMKKSKRIEAWCTLVHVCRRWRAIVFASPRRLNLRLRCTERTPVKEMLDVWPALPIKVCNVGGPMSLAGGADDIIAALEHNDRVCEISLWGVPSWLLGSLCAAMEDPFVELTDLFLWPNNESAPVFLPDSFLGGSAPRLRSLDLNSVAFPALGKLLLSASHHLTSLRLRNVPAAGYVSPEEMVACLSAVPRLEIFQLEFQSPRSRPDRAERRLPALRPALTRAVLPALTEFAFQGVSRYLEDLVARIDAPLLHDVAITLFKQLIFSTPQFLQFIGRLETFKGLNRAEVTFSRRSVAVTLSRPLSPQTGQQRRRPGVGTGTKNVDVVDRRTLTLRILLESDGQISSLAQVCRSSLPPPSPPWNASRSARIEIGGRVGGMVRRSRSGPSFYVRSAA
ncbi:hypothetical protein BC826DRAFT_83896 [Russula brevipes]|nr:hypothetical protein BC826DRAFT_83896 [Russula brevipes]